MAMIMPSGARIPPGHTTEQLGSMLATAWQSPDLSPWVVLITLKTAVSGNPRFSLPALPDFGHSSPSANQMYDARLLSKFAWHESSA